MVSLGIALFTVSTLVPLIGYLFTGDTFTRAFENELERVEQQGLLAPVVPLRRRATDRPLKMAA